MAIEILDLLQLADEKRSRTNVFDTPRLHAWMHYYPPGRKDEMHCHNGDQTFVVLQGECTMSFPDGGSARMLPGQAALIQGGSFYQLENTGDEGLVMMGNRSGPAASSKKIDYVTRQDLRQQA